MLLIDNYDSFAHNLARYFTRLGQDVRVVRNDRVTVDQLLADPPTSIVMSPGPGAPRDAGNCLEIARRLGGRIPLLGVCLGHQVIAEAWGAEVSRGVSPFHGRASWVRHRQQGVFAGMPSPMRVGRYHSLVVKRSTLPNGFEATAETDDGVNMAFQHRELPIVGFQFHPESALTEHGYTLLAAFLKLAGQSVTVDPAQLQEAEFRGPIQVGSDPMHGDPMYGDRPIHRGPAASLSGSRESDRTSHPPTDRPSSPNGPRHPITF